MQGNADEGPKSKLDELIRAGIVTPARTRSSDAPPDSGVQRMPLAQILADLSADRSER
jgi:hypothetical protein